MSEEDTQVSIHQPSLINIHLFLHQLKSIEQMQKMEKDKEIILHPSIFISTKVGVLADLPGYGKSLSVLGLVGQTLGQISPEPTYVLEKTKYHQYLSQTTTEVLQKTNCSLILVNISLLSQWIYELNRTLLKFIAVYKTADIEDIPLDEYDVVLVANNIYNLFSQVYRKKYWKRFVIDEPASLKLPSMEDTNANFYWLVTGTPSELYSNNRRRTGFMNDLLPEEVELFNHVIVKNDDQFVKSSYDMPLTKYIYYQCSGNISSLFDGILSDTIVEMIQAGNISGVFNSLLEEKENVYLTIFEAYKSRKTKRLLELQKEEKNNDKIQLLESHLHLLEEKIFKYVIQNPCVICNQPHTRPSVLSCCQHIVCGTCMIETCPLCRSDNVVLVPLIVKELDTSNEQVVVGNRYASKNKINTLLDIVGNAQEKKILIFSNYNESFAIIKKFLDEKNLSYLELRGTKEKRDNTIDSYKTGSVNILLLNTIHSGAGLNLQETTDIILYHRIHECQKVQVIGRANRIGRKIQLNVHYLE